jgi:FkbM family methyltransferase
VDHFRIDLRAMSLDMRDLILRGCYEPEERILCRKHLSSEDGILEFGSGIGYLGLFCQLNLGVRQYASVEANPHTWKLLLRNYELNGVRPLGWNCALAGRSGSVEVRMGENFWAARTVDSGQDSSAREAVKAPCGTTRELMERPGFPVSALIVDVEGAEVHLAPCDFPDTVCKVIIEMHPQLIGPEPVAALCQQLEDAGFKCREQQGDVSVFLRS